MTQQKEKLGSIWVNLKTSEKAVEDLIKKSFYGNNINPVVVKLKSKGQINSLKIGINFDRRDDFMNSTIWSKNSTMKSFLFRR